MKRILVLLAAFLTGFFSLSAANAQFIRGNAYNLPMIGGEVAFIQNDTAASLNAEDFYAVAKSWVEQNYPAAKFTKDDQENNSLQAIIHFKIDDQHIQAPLYYQGTLHIKWKDQVIQVKLDELSYTPGRPKGKSRKNTGVTEVSFEVKQQVRSGADKLYPHTWDSLNDYGITLLQDFSQNLIAAAKNLL